MGIAPALLFRGDTQMKKLILGSACFLAVLLTAAAVMWRFSGEKQEERKEEHPVASGTAAAPAGQGTPDDKADPNRKEASDGQAAPDIPADPDGGAETASKEEPVGATDFGDDTPSEGTGEGPADVMESEGTGEGPADVLESEGTGKVPDDGTETEDGGALGGEAAGNNGEQTDATEPDTGNELPVDWLN